MKPNLAVLHFLVALRNCPSFTRAEVRELWQGDVAFQCVWSYLIFNHRIEEIERGLKSRGYRWRVAK